MNEQMRQPKKRRVDWREARLRFNAILQNDTMV